jgi:predicted DNA-binding transcriptional regulator YafY
VDLAEVRQAIRDERKLWIAYADEKGVRSERVIWPIAVAYYVQATLVGAWCELRRDYRHFRADRITAMTVLEERYPSDNGRLMAEWLALRQNERETTE